METIEMTQEVPACRVVIVGSSGRMGRMLTSRALAAGIDVEGIDQPLNDENLGKCANADLVIISVPAARFEGVVKKIVPFLRPDCILADITSVKEAPMRQMEKHWHGPVVGTHPLFGPRPDPDSDLPVCLVAGSGANQKNRDTVTGFFQNLGCRVFEATAEQHDKAMAAIQNMNFITNLAFFAAIAGRKDLLPFLTPSFKRRKDAAAKMLNEDAEMFMGLFEANPHSHEAVRKYRKMLNLAASGDIELLCRRAQWWWDDPVDDVRENEEAQCSRS